MECHFLLRLGVKIINDWGTLTVVVRIRVRGVCTKTWDGAVRREGTGFTKRRLRGAEKREKRSV